MADFQRLTVLQDRGVDFPVRPQVDAGGLPYYTPPPVPAATVAAAQGLSPEDRAAIAAAVADLEAQEAQQATAESALTPPGLPSGGHVPAMMGPAVLMGAPIRPPGYSPPPGQGTARLACTQSRVQTPYVLTLGLLHSCMLCPAGYSAPLSHAPVVQPAAVAAVMQLFQASRPASIQTVQ